MQQVFQRDLAPRTLPDAWCGQVVQHAEFLQLLPRLPHCFLQLRQQSVVMRKARNPPPSPPQSSASARAPRGLPVRASSASFQAACSSHIAARLANAASAAESAFPILRKGGLPWRFFLPFLHQRGTVAGLASRSLRRPAQFLKRRRRGLRRPLLLRRPLAPAAAEHGTGGLKGAAGRLLPALLL